MRKLPMGPLWLSGTAQGSCPCAIRGGAWTLPGGLGSRFWAQLWLFHSLGWSAASRDACTPLGVGWTQRPLGPPTLDLLMNAKPECVSALAMHIFRKQHYAYVCATAAGCGIGLRGFWWARFRCCCWPWLPGLSPTSSPATADLRG